ncbi:hypothetical protein ACIBI0_38580 [Microbispora rosea]|uniref:hypothetical protein n=1 Tax=Microbispora rosea TaxID=58117 RepID=UPI0037AB29EE
MADFQDLTSVVMAAIPVSRSGATAQDITAVARQEIPELTVDVVVVTLTALHLAGRVVITGPYGNRRYVRRR